MGKLLGAAVVVALACASCGGDAQRDRTASSRPAAETKPAARERRSTALDAVARRLRAAGRRTAPAAYQPPVLACLEIPMRRGGFTYVFAFPTARQAAEHLRVSRQTARRDPGTLAVAGREKRFYWISYGGGSRRISPTRDAEFRRIVRIAEGIRNAA